MKIFTTLYPRRLIFLTSIVDIASADGGIPCGQCHYQDNQNNELLLWGSFDSNNNPVFDCNKISDELTLGTCVNELCDTCGVWK